MRVHDSVLGTVQYKQVRGLAWDVMWGEGCMGWRLENTTLSSCCLALHAFPIPSCSCHPSQLTRCLPPRTLPLQVFSLANEFAQRAQQTWLYAQAKQRLPQAAVDTGE